MPNTFKVIRLAAASFGLALIVALVACGGADNHATTQDVTTTTARPNADELLSAMLTPAGPTSAAEALARLPRPAATSSRTVASNHGGTGEVTTRDFDGLSVSTYQVAKGSATLLTGVRLTSGAAPLHGLTIGMAADAARERLSAAQTLPPVSGATASYAITNDPVAAPYQVDLTVSDGVVTAVMWSAYLD